MNLSKMILVGVACLIVNFIPASGYALTATMSINPAAVTVTDRGIECATNPPDLVSLVSTYNLDFGSGYPDRPILHAGLAQIIGQGAITATLENSGGDKGALINQPYGDEILTRLYIELFVDPSLIEQPIQHISQQEYSFRQYMVGKSYSTGAVVFTIRGVLADAAVYMYGYNTAFIMPFQCSGLGMVEIRLPFSVRFE